jgi:hypothetical protein
MLTKVQFSRVRVIFDPLVSTLFITIKVFVMKIF